MPIWRAPLGQDPVYFINGGHRPDGGIQAPLDIAALDAAANKLKFEVSAFAVAGHFATRNPLHETKTRDLLRKITGLPVTCSHELSSSLGGAATRPDRGVKCPPDKSSRTADYRYAKHHFSTRPYLPTNGGQG